LSAPDPQSQKLIQRGTRKEKVMNPPTPLKCLATFFLPIGVLLLATARPASANLIVNGDFQTGTLAGWTHYTGDHRK
jgi:hypothetical protein